MSVKKVYQAINAVQSDLAKLGIPKEQTNTFDRYSFRGIDDVYNALSPLLAKHGLCILPRVLGRDSVERESQKGGALFYVTVDVEFDFVSAEDGSIHTVRIFGEAMDRGDKATSKAMSAAYKYAAFQTFAIPTEGDNDSDASTHEVKTQGRRTGISIDQEASTINRICKQSGALKAREYVESLKSRASLTEHQIAEIWKRLDDSTRSSLKSNPKEAA